MYDPKDILLSSIQALDGRTWSHPYVKEFSEERDRLISEYEKRYGKCPTIEERSLGGVY